MPELPEVESLAAFLAERATGAVVANVEVFAFSALKTYDPPVTALTGRTLAATSRHGKFIDLDFSDGGDALHLLIHLARAGWLRWRDELPRTMPKRGKGPLALRVRFQDGAGFDVTEAGTQRKVAAYVVRDPEEVPGVARLGPDPLAADFTVDSLRDLVGGRRTQIKGLLRDQSVIAGIGNAYSDEILHAARMSPFRVAATLEPEDVQRLYDATIGVLSDAVRRSAGLAAKDLKGDKKSNLAVHGRTGEACPVCGDTVREVSFADSSLQYCPTCQTGGKVLADRRLSRLLK
ncbi:MAG: Fpg/Nei family DNA glycosylase [Streptosporangiales bacterium]|nr:Fpg/Nei family DNA glycosylase [Streptosporangiales bacterium]MBO0890420.1 Fpg/Nei family DNA glycosylase [Acidothermales bacterium]